MAEKKQKRKSWIRQYENCMALCSITENNELIVYVFIYNGEAQDNNSVLFHKTVKLKKKDDEKEQDEVLDSIMAAASL